MVVINFSLRYVKNNSGATRAQAGTKVRGGGRLKERWFQFETLYQCALAFCLR